MSIQYMENFSIYGDSKANLIAGTPWSLASNDELLNDPDGVSGGKVLRIVSPTSFQARAVLPTATDVTYVAWRQWLADLPSEVERAPSIQIRDANNFIRYLVRVTPVGSLVLVRTDGAEDIISSGEVAGFTILSTSGNVINDGLWQHCEFFLNRTTGAYTFKVEGVTIMTGTDGAPATGDTAIVSFRNPWNNFSGTGPTTYIKDVVFADDGGSVNNTGIGTVQVITLSPNADVSSGWTRSSGLTDFSLVNELAPNDASFIQAEDVPLPAATVMELTNLPPDVVAVRALQTMVRGIKSDGGDATMVVSLVSNALDDTGKNHAVATSISYYWDVSELDPDGGVAWTPVKVDLARIKIDRTV